MKLNQVPFSGDFAGNIESRVHALRLVFKKDKGTSTTGQDLLDAIPDVTLKIDKGTPTGVKTKIYKIGALDLMTVCIPEGGFVSADVVGSKLVVKGTVVLSHDGAEQLQDNEYYKVTIEGVPEDVTCDVYIVDAAMTAQKSVTYTLVRVTGKAPKVMNVASALFLAIPKEGLNQLDLQYVQGAAVTYLPEELEYLTTAGLPQGFLVDGNTVPGGGDFYIIPVGAAVNAKIDSDDDFNVVVINEEWL